MSADDIIRSMRDSSDEELLAITSGAAMGYTEQARAIAEEVLRERHVQLPPNLEESRKRGADAEVEANRLNADQVAAQDRALGRAWGIRLIVIGIGGFVLPIAGLQFELLMPFGSALPIAAAIVAIVGYILLVRTRGDAPLTFRITIPRYVHVTAVAVVALSLFVLWAAGLFRSRVNPVIVLVPPAAVYLFYFKLGGSHRSNDTSHRDSGEHCDRNA
jgi:hypothetical protein